MRMIVGGVGGKGGYAVWFPVPSSWTIRYNEDGWVVSAQGRALPEQESSLELIELHGGHGGSAARVGGNGGDGGYRGFEPRVGDPVAAVEVSGGEGGDVFASPVPVVAPKGGDGGGFYVWGSRGWSGGLDPDGRLLRDGSHGGSVFGWGGKGGDILGDASHFPGGIGGKGGAPDGPHPWGIALGSSGGGGMFSCEEGGPGGNGGDPGPLRILGGDGGRGPIDGTRGESGGDGGDVCVILPSPGQGGDGDPPEMGGKIGYSDIGGGQGGAGATLGRDGAWTGADFMNKPPGDPGKTCSGGRPKQPDDHPFDFSCKAISSYRGIGGQGEELTLSLNAFGSCTMLSSGPSGSLFLAD